MGFDIYGMDPVTNGYKEPQAPDTDYDYESKEWQTYFDLKEKYLDNVPGAYFRASVWYWRPIALFLQEHMDFLDTEDNEGMDCNSGHVVNSDKAHRIAERIQDLDAIGEIDEWVRNKKIAIVMMSKEDCAICDGTGVRTDRPLLGDLEPLTKNGIEGVKCNGCKGEGTRDPWESNYPYDTKVILEFGHFASESGGFQIC
mgnify:CR=1 FL=1